MEVHLKDHTKFIGKEGIGRIMEEAEALHGKHIVHVNSTYYGGGVAEMLGSLVPLFNDAGIKTGWRAIKGNPDFFSITKRFHNALQGDRINLSGMKKRLYEGTNRQNSLFTHIEDHDHVIVHDPQPLPLIDCYRKKQPWLWRCHIDVSSPDPCTWDYLKGFVSKYDMAIVSKQEYGRCMPIDSAIIHPSIDPLAPKNKELSEATVAKYLRKFGIDLDKPIISQVSRFDKWKDPQGVMEAFRQVRRKHDCQLVMLGSSASDDPEGQQIYESIQRSAGEGKDIRIINYENHILVNALQRASSVVIQKSIKEGFGLTVSEALWKRTPVVAGKVGGIPLQVEDGKSGYLVDSVDQCAKRVSRLLSDDKLREQMGEAGHEHVRNNFLVTRHLHDYLRLLRRIS